MLDTSVLQARMLGITPNMNKLVKMTIDYDDSKFKAIANQLWLSENIESCLKQRKTHFFR